MKPTSEETAPNGVVVETEAARRRRVLRVTLLLLVGLPIYLIAASYIVGTLTAPVIENGEPVKPLHWSVELLIYVVLGVVWALPMKRLVAGVGRKRA